MARRDARWVAGDRRYGEFSNRSFDTDPADPIADGLGEPQVPIWARGDGSRAIAPRDGDVKRKLGDGSLRRDPCDPVAVELGEPQVPIWAVCNAEWVTGWRGNGELGEGAVRADAADLVAQPLCEP